MVDAAVLFVKAQLHGAEAGHDWYHTERVWKLSKKIAEKEGGNMLIIELAALLHDVADPKFHNGDEELAIRLSGDFLTSIDIAGKVKEQILHIIKHMSFKNRTSAPQDPPLELQIVQDADRLDAIGAIGIARTFNFGGFKNDLIYHPGIPPKIGMTKMEYKKSNGTTINHFYEKLLLLKDLMNTETARRMAERRHQFMLNFLEEFYRDWNLTSE